MRAVECSQLGEEHVFNLAFARQAIAIQEAAAPGRMCVQVNVKGEVAWEGGDACERRREA